MIEGLTGGGVQMQLNFDLWCNFQDFNHARQERDRYQTANYIQNKEKEESMQQNAELKVKLDAMVKKIPKTYTVQYSM